MSDTTNIPAPTGPGLRLGVLLLFAASALAAATWWSMNQSGPAGASLQSREPPALATTGTWLNSATPLNLADLRGKVVYLQFSFLGCGFCRKMDPYLRQWHEKYSANGLVVIEVDNGAIDTTEAVGRWVKKDSIAFPVLYDAGGKTVASYGIGGFPTMYLVGRDGKVISEWRGWPGENGVTKIEDAIRTGLAAK